MRGECNITGSVTDSSVYDLTTLITPDDYQGGHDIAKMYCRLVGSAAGRPRRLVTLRGPQGHMNCIGRVDGFREGLVDYGCADAVTMPEELDVNLDFGVWWAKNFTLEKLATSKIDGVFSCNDNMAIGAVQAAKLVRTSGTLGLLISGFDNIDAVVPFVADGDIYATVSNSLGYTTFGLVPTLLSLFDGFDYTNPSGLGTLPWPLAPQTSVMDSYVRDLVLTGYDAKNPPSRKTKLKITIRHESVRNVDMVQATFTVSGRVKYEWIDPRIRFLPEVWGLRELIFHADELWTPRLRPKDYIEWTDSIADLKVKASGRVEMEEVFSLTTLCRFKLTRFPADDHRCPMRFILDKPAIEIESLTVDLKSYNDLVGWLPLEFSGEAAVGEDGLDSEAKFTVKMRRDYNAYMLMFVFPSIVVTTISISALTFDDSLGNTRVQSGILGFLTALAIRSSAGDYLPRSATLTWLDWWLLGSMLFQLVPFFCMVSHVHCFMVRWARHKIAMRARRLQIKPDQASEEGEEHEGSLPVVRDTTGDIRAWTERHPEIDRSLFFGIYSAYAVFVAVMLDRLMQR